jgi:hypothetical protein
MGIQQPTAPVPQPEPAPIAEQRVLNALVEGTSIDSTLRAIINDIGEPITSVYDTMKFQAKKYMENHGELGRGFRMVAAGVGGRWVQNMYIGRLHNELHDLCKYNTRRTVELRDFLRGEESNGEIEMKRSFGNLANNLPPILAKLGEQINAPQLTRNARRWMQNKAEYERYLMDLEAEGDDELDDEPVIKPPKSNVVGQQNAQVDQIVNDILSKIPKHIAGEIRNAIARSPNKLSALKQELNKHHVTMSEDNDAMSHMAKNLTGHGSPIARAAAQRDKKREQQSTQSHGRAEGPKWDIAEEEIKNNHWYDAGVKDATRGARPNPRSIQYKLKANHPDEVYFYMQGYKSVKQGVAEGAPELLKAEMPMVRHIENELATKGYKKGTEEYKKMFGHALAYYRKFGFPDYRKGVAEARMSAAQRLWNAEQKQRAKSDASLARTPSSIPKPEPKKDEKTTEANVKNPQPYNKPGWWNDLPEKERDAYLRYARTGKSEPRTGNSEPKKVAEKMMPASNFAGSKKNKLGPAGQWKNTGPKKNKPAQAGDLVGGMEESLKDSNPCWKGYHPVGTKKKAGKTVPNCVPVSENVEDIMDALINKIIVNEATNK